MNKALSIGNINDRISFLEEVILEKEDDYDELCDRNMEILNDTMQLSDPRHADAKQYFVLKRKEQDIQLKLLKSREEQECLLNFYGQQFIIYEAAVEFVKLPERTAYEKHPGRLLTTKEKLFLLSKLHEYKALFPLRKRKDLTIVLPLIMGVKQSSIVDDLKYFEKPISNKSRYWVDSLKKIKNVLVNVGFTNKQIISDIDQAIYAGERLLE